MAGYHVQTGSRHIVRQMTVDEQTLDRVAEALGIPPAERQQFISETESIHIYRSTRPTPGAPPTPGVPPTPGAPPTPGTPPPPPGGGSRP
jgi:hypothetical protein